jgi:hypothetical protein
MDTNILIFIIVFCLIFIVDVILFILGFVYKNTKIFIGCLICTVLYVVLFIIMCVVFYPQSELNENQYLISLINSNLITTTPTTLFYTNSTTSIGSVNPSFDSFDSVVLKTLNISNNGTTGSPPTSLSFSFSPSRKFDYVLLNPNLSINNSINAPNVYNSKGYINSFTINFGTNAIYEQYVNNNTVMQMIFVYNQNN